MLKRKITKVLEDWKKEDKKPCLLIRGARQVGKTFIIDDFAKKNYENYIYINFELMPEYKSIFNGNLDIKTLIMKLEVTFPNINIVPNKTILFLDEIQSCPNARTALNMSLRVVLMLPHKSLSAPQGSLKNLAMKLPALSARLTNLGP